jgi:outer membrane lipoprotein-sorting protein
VHALENNEIVHTYDKFLRLTARSSRHANTERIWLKAKTWAFCRIQTYFIKT